jgi:hypothetical protein
MGLGGIGWDWVGLGLTCRSTKPANFQDPPMPPLDVPRSGWMTEDVVLLEEQARRFIVAEFVPHLERMPRR